MIRARSTIAALLFCAHGASALAGLSAASVNSASQVNAPAPKQVSHAVGLYLTARGQQYFHKHLEDLLFRQGYSLSEGGFDTWEYKATQPLILDHLPGQYEQYHGTLAAVRDIFRRWLRHTLNDPLIAARIDGIRYQVKFDKLGASVDLRSTRTMFPQGGGLVLDFEVEIPSLMVGAPTIRAMDLANQFLGTLGMNGFWAGLHEESAPLRIRVPIVVRLENGVLRNEVLALESNLREVRLDADFDRPLLLPKVQVIVNGKTMTLKQNKVEEALLKHKDRLIAALQSYLADLAEERVPLAVNELVRRSMPTGLQEVNDMDPPGAETIGPDDKFKWGMSPEMIHVSNDFLHVGLSGFVNDPKLKVQPPYRPSSARTAFPLLNQENPAQYDVAIALNQDLINRILELSYKRGYFDRIEMQKDTFLKLLDPPRLWVDRNGPRDRAKVHVRAAQKVSGMETWVVRSPFEFEADIDVRLVLSKKGTLSVNLDRIDEKSVRVDKRFIKMGLFEGLVMSKIRKTVRKGNVGLKSHPRVLIEELPVPREVAGVPIRVKNFQSDSNGFLVLYVEYDFAQGDFQ
jgi:hypothetical protein